MRKTLALVFAFSAAASPLCAQDILRFKDPARNPDLEGDVTLMSARLIEFETPGDGARIARTADPRDVAEIIPANVKKTLDFIRGEEALLNRDVAAAVQRFERVIADPRAGDVLRQTAGIQIVRAFAAAGNPAGVVQTAQALRARKPDSFFAREAYQLEIRADLSLRKPDAAAAALKAFSALALAQGRQDWNRVADLLEAELAESQGNWRGALAGYRKNGRDPETAEESALGELRCLTSLADWPGLQGRADAVLKESAGKKTTPPRLLVAAYMGKGDADANAGKLKDALFSYLQAAVVQARGERGPEHETAIARSSIVMVRIAAKATDPAVKTAYRSKSVELLQELVSLYPGSRYKAEVEKSLREIR